MATRSDNFERLTLATPELSLVIIPELGGKILQIVDPSSGTDLIWLPPDKRGLFRNRPGDVYVAGPLTGADECFPTIAPCMWEGRALADHGDLWALPWTVLKHTAREVDLNIQPPESPFVFRRRITIAGNSAHFAYTLENRGKKEQSFVWAFHPMLNYQPGDRLEIPATSARIDAQINTPFGDRGSVISLPEPHPGVRLDRFDFGPFQSAAVKFFTDRLSSGRVTLVRSALQRQLVFAFDPEEIQTFGIWINRGGGADYLHVIIEPGHGAPDALDVAASWNRCAKIAAGAVMTWAFTLSLENIATEEPNAGAEQLHQHDH